MNDDPWRLTLCLLVCVYLPWQIVWAWNAPGRVSLSCSSSLSEWLCICKQTCNATSRSGWHGRWLLTNTHQIWENNDEIGACVWTIGRLSMTLLSEAHMQTEIRFVMSFVGGCVGGEEISFVANFFGASTGKGENVEFFVRLKIGHQIRHGLVTMGQQSKILLSFSQSINEPFISGERE